MTENPNITQALRGLRETFKYMNTRYGPNKNGYWWAIAHRARLIDTGQYIKTSQQTRITIVLGTPQPRTLRIGEEIGKLIKFSQEDS